MFFFKKEKGGFDSHPPTPKIPSVSLPESGGGQDFAPLRPSSPWIATPRPIPARPASTRPFLQRVDSESPAPVTPPLKSCLKQRQRTMTTGDASEAARAMSKLRDYDSPPPKVSPTTRERRFSTTGGGTPMPKPKKVSPPPSTPHPLSDTPFSKTVPMKPPHLPLVNLHWQLLPHNSRCLNKPLLCFDISFPPSNMYFAPTSTTPYKTSLRNSDLNKPVADEPLEEMTIECDKLPKGAIRIKRSSKHGITCRDVFEEIYRAYNQVLSEADCRRELPPPHSEEFIQVSAAFKARCLESPALDGWEERQKLRRVDLLQGKTKFLGLTQPKPSSNWVLQLGHRY